MQINEIDSLKFPLLGSLRDGEPFEYLLLSIDTDVAEIALLQWFRSRAQLHVGDQIDLHLPYLFSTNNTISGSVIATTHNEEQQGKIYQIRLDAKYQSFDQYTRELHARTTLRDVFISLIKDSMILKSGIRVYFKHLIPYFSRIADYSHQEYSRLKQCFLHDVETRIIDNEAKLERFYQIAKEKITKQEEIAVHIDLDFLREILESEISLPVFTVIFSEDEISKLSLLMPPQSGVFMYINAIKNLERRLYSNYNHMVLIYLKSI